MTDNEIDGATSAALLVVGFIPYIVGILRTRNLPPGHPDKIEPKKATWLIWSSNDIMAYAAMFVAGTAQWQIGSAVFMASTLFTLSLLYGTRDWTWLDLTCISLSVVAGFLWYIFNSPTVAIIMCMSILGLGTIPTAVSSWKTPEKEDLLTWVIFNISSIFGLMAVTDWYNPDKLAQPATFMLTDGIILGILLLRRDWFKNTIPQTR